MSTDVVQLRSDRGRLQQSPVSPIIPNIVPAVCRRRLN